MRAGVIPSLERIPIGFKATGRGFNSRCREKKALCRKAIGLACLWEMLTVIALGSLPAPSTFVMAN